MVTTAMVHVRVDEDVKERASTALGAMGLTLSDGVRVFLSRVAADQAIPFAIAVPNATTEAAMAEARSMGETRFKSADGLFDALAKEGC